MIQLDAEMPADIGQFRRKKLPGLSREIDRAEVIELGRGDPVERAAFHQHFAIEAHVVGRDEIHAFETGPDLRPELPESRGMLDVLPAQAVNVGEDELAGWRPDQVDRLVPDLPVFHADQTDGARAVAGVVGRFEVECEEIHGLTLTTDPGNVRAVLRSRAQNRVKLPLESGPSGRSWIVKGN